MKKSIPIKLATPITINKQVISHVVIGQHYKEKHSSYMTDELILSLVLALDGKEFEADSTSKNIKYLVI